MGCPLAKMKLNINVKNTQLAAALNKIKKPDATKAPPKPSETPPRAEEKHAEEKAAEKKTAVSKKTEASAPAPILAPTPEVKAPAPAVTTPEPKAPEPVATAPSPPSAEPVHPTPPSESPAPPKAVEPKPAPQRIALPPRYTGPRPSYNSSQRTSYHHQNQPQSQPPPRQEPPRFDHRSGEGRNTAYTPRPTYPQRSQSGPGRDSGAPHSQNSYPSSQRPSGPYNSRPPQGGTYQPRPYNNGPSHAPSGGSGYSGGPAGNSGGYRPPYRSGPYQPRPPGPPGQQREGYRPPFRPGFGPRPFVPPKESTHTDDPKKRTRPEDDTSPRKATPFKEFRDVKATKKVDAHRAFDSRDKQGLRQGDDEAWRPRRRHTKGHHTQEEFVIRPKNLKVRLPVTLKDLAAEMKLKASQLISSLFMKGVVLTLNDVLDDPTTVQLLGHDFDCEITIDTSEEERLKITDKTIKQEVLESPPEQLQLRSPVVAFMGHVDHGKTSLIDAIRKSDIASGEAGAITQHIGAFKCHTAVGAITILDTPGHEAFSAMRERGADVTDLVVLVIAGDEGMRTQTIEAMQQAQEANVTIMVALNKSDKPNFNPETVYRQLSENNLLPEAWGGSTITVNCSALTGEGIKELLEMLAIQTEVLELKSNPSMRARGTVIESQMHKGLGSVATVLVQNGTLRLGDAVVFGHQWGRVKTMHDEHGKEMKEAGPSTPAKITGLSGLPEAGSEFIVVKNERTAQEVSEGRLHERKHLALHKKKAGIESLLQKEAQRQVKKVLPLILRADVQGSLEALRHSLEKIVSSKVEVNIVSAEVGEISTSDIERAAASKAAIIGFHTQVESHASSLIRELKVDVKLHDIIYHAKDDVRDRMLALLDKIPQENDVGSIEVKMLYKSSQVGTIAGCQVIDGTIRRNHSVRVMRDKEMVWKGPIASLKRLKEDVREVSKGQECGVVLQGFSAFKEGDILQAFEITYLTQEL